MGVGRGGVEKGKRHQPAGVVHRGAREPVRGGEHCYTPVSSESHGLITWGLNRGGHKPFLITKILPEDPGTKGFSRENQFFLGSGCGRATGTDALHILTPSVHSVAPALQWTRTDPGLLMFGHPVAKG